MRPASWIPPLAWMAVILVLSSDAASSQQTGAVLGPLVRWLVPWASPWQVDAVHMVVRKTAHVTVYAVLAGLWFRFLFRGRGWSRGGSVLVVLLIALAWASLDELHQSFTPSRTGAVGDVVIDGVGAALAVVGGATGWRRALERATDVLLLVAALGGALVIAVDAAAGVPARAFWITGPAAAVILALRWRRRARPAGAQPDGARTVPSRH